MGQLKEGATYIYERNGGVVYAREFGADPNTRVHIGMEIYKSIDDNYWNSRLWDDILKEAKTNPTLQKALEHVIMLYRLSKDDPL